LTAPVLGTVPAGTPEIIFSRNALAAPLRNPSGPDQTRAECRRFVDEKFWEECAVSR
jgi:hypothetical protein